MIGGSALISARRALADRRAGRAPVACHYFDTLVLTVGGVDVRGGVTEYNLDDAAVKRAAFASSRRRIAVADATKLNRTAFARVCTIEELDVLVTDDSAPRPAHEFRAAGIEVVVA